MAGRREHDRAGHEILRRRAGKVLGARRALGDRHVPGGLDELRELLVGHLGRVHPEAVHVDAMNRPGIGRGLHADHVHAGRLRRRPSRTRRRESTPCPGAPSQARTLRLPPSAGTTPPLTRSRTPAIGRHSATTPRRPRAPGQAARESFGRCDRLCRTTDVRPAAVFSRASCGWPCCSERSFGVRTIVSDIIPGFT